MLLSLVALVLALVEAKVRGQGLKEVVDEEKEEKYSGQEWDYYEEEVASSSSRDKRRRRQAFGEERSSGGEDSISRLKKSAIRINQEMSELNTKNNTEPLLVEDPPGIGLGHILGNNVETMILQLRRADC